MLSTLSVLGLALVDSLSAGTLVIPLMMVMNQRGVNIRPLSVYFSTVCASYFLIGVTLLVGLDQLRNTLRDALNSDPVLWLQLIVGVALLVYGIAAPTPKKDDGTRVRQPRNLTTAAMIGLAMTAVVIEAATMVPYLAAIAILSDSALGLAGKLGVLTLYCLVMILPALVCIGLIRAFGERIWNRVEKFARWVEHETKVTILWIAAIIGFYLAGNAVRQLDLL